MPNTMPLIVQRSLQKYSLAALALSTILVSLPTAFAFEPEEKPPFSPSTLGNDWNRGSEITPSISAIHAPLSLRQPHSLTSEGFSQEKEGYVEHLSSPAFPSRKEESLAALKIPLSPQAEGTLLTQELEEEEEEPALPQSSLRRRIRPFSSMDAGPRTPLTDEQVTQFALNLHDFDRQIQTLIDAGIEPNEDNRAVRFLSEEEVFERLANNQHGHLLDLSNTSFETSSSLRLLEGIGATQSGYEVNLTNCRFKPQFFEALCKALYDNKSVQRLNLSQAALPQGALELLGESLKHSRGLQQLLLPLEASFKPNEIERFYDHMHFNTTLALIRWPKEVIEVVEKLARKKPTAMVHIGFLYTISVMKLNEQKKERRALHYFQEADRLKHPLGAYGLAMIHEKHENYEEALHYYEKAAEGDNLRAQMILSTYHRALWPQKAPLLKKADYLLGFNWARRAAQLGYPEALYRVGRMYEAARFVAKSLTKAGNYFYDALQAGHPEAFSAFGMLYFY